VGREVGGVFAEYTSIDPNRLLEVRETISETPPLGCSRSSTPAFMTSGPWMCSPGLRDLAASHGAAAPSTNSPAASSPASALQAADYQVNR
jgi:hypothetical protein